MFKKSFYIFMTSILGVLVFVVINRIAVFTYLYLIAAGYLTPTVNYISFILWDSFWLIITMMLGSWYGVWLGLGWYKQVYEEGTHLGFIDHVTRNYWPTSGSSLDSRVVQVKQKIEKEFSEPENLAAEEDEIFMPIVREQPKPKVRRVVRKTAPKKVK